MLQKGNYNICFNIPNFFGLNSVIEKPNVEKEVLIRFFEVATFS